jgi:hypothetical protein
MNKCFVITNKAWYAKSLTLDDPEILIGDYTDDGGCTMEFNITWRDLRDNELTPRLMMFNDSWKAFEYYPELFKLLPELDSKKVSQDDFINELLKLGFEDHTQYEDPEKQKAIEYKIAKLEKELKELKKEL